MKPIYIILFFLFTCNLNTSAQDFPPPPPSDHGPGPRGEEGGRGRDERIEALYIAYISRELKLTEEDAQKFWPVHGQFDEEMRSLRFVKMPELDRQQSILNIKKKYQDKFIKVLGSKRTDDFFRKDEEFRKKLVERLQEMKQHKKGDIENEGPPMRKRP